MEEEIEYKVNLDLPKKLVDFCKFLRDNQLLVTTSEILDANMSLTEIDLSKKDEFYSALKSCLAKRIEDYQLFDLLFSRFWLGAKEIPKQNHELKGRLAMNSGLRRPSRIQLDSHPYGHASSARLAFNVDDKDKSAGLSEINEGMFAIYSAAESLQEKKFSGLDRNKSIHSLKRGLKRFSKTFATYPGRRFAVSSSGVIDIRRSIRRSLSSCGEIVSIRRREHKLAKTRFVILCDISGSMDTYSEEILTILYYACSTIRRTDAFGFSTRLIYMNRYLIGKTLGEARLAIEKNVNVWGGGTRIGYALGHLIKQYPGMLHPKSVFLIISDGWELGELESLESNLKEVRRRVAKIIWLNPLADSPEYRPITAGMETALPYVDFLFGLRIFFDGRNLGSGVKG